MAQFINDNYRLLAGKPLDDYYMVKPDVNEQARAYKNVYEAYQAIPYQYRYLGLTVLVKYDNENREFWFKDGVSDSDLVLKVNIPSTANIPVPQLEVNKNKVTGEYQLRAYFLPTAFNFEQGNPELWLFRWKEKRKKGMKGTDKLRKRQAWVHPSDTRYPDRWEGWKFYSGKQSVMAYKDGNNNVLHDAFDAEGRKTEFAIPSLVKPYERFTIDFNKNMFWNYLDPNTNNVNYDVNVFEGQNIQLPDLDSFGQRIGGKKKRRRKPKIQKFALAIAIDNPLATKANGLPPKVFGPMSDAFFTSLKTDNGVITGIEINLNTPYLKRVPNSTV